VGEIENLITNNQQPTTNNQLKPVGLVFGLTLVGLFVLASLIFYFAYTSQRDAVADFFIEWKGTQVALEGGNPYSDETTRQIQLGSKGRLVDPGEDQLAFVYPYWRIFFSIPIAGLSYQWASAIWLGFILTLYVGALFLTGRAIGWRPTSAQASSGYYLALIFAFPAFSSLMLGQSALLVAALLGGVYYCLKVGASGWAGSLLALATVKPQLTLVLIPLLFLRALWRRDWRFILGFFITLAVLAVISFIMYPAWFSEFVAVASRYPSYKRSLTGPGFTFDWLGGGLATAVSWAVWLLIAGAGLWQWWRYTQAEPAGTKPGLPYDLAFSIGLILTLLLPPQTNISNPVLLFLPLTLIFAKLRGGLYGLLVVGVIAISWGLYFVFYNSAYGVLIVVPPVLVTILLYRMYRKINIYDDRQDMQDKML